MHILPDSILNNEEMEAQDILDWINANQHYAQLDDVTVCDCCGDGEGWYGTPGANITTSR